MTPWEGKRSLTIVSACMGADGCPTFAMNEVQVTFDEYENGVHIDLVEELLVEDRYEEPYVPYDEIEAPDFLVLGVAALLAYRWELPEPVTDLPEEIGCGSSKSPSRPRARPPSRPGAMPARAAARPADSWKRRWA